MLSKEERDRIRDTLIGSAMVRPEDLDTEALLDTCDALESRRDTTEQINAELLRKVEYLEAERNQLLAKCDSYVIAWREIMDEPCPESDDRKHCTCVPSLRIGIQELEAERDRLKALCRDVAAAWDLDTAAMVACGVESVSSKEMIHKLREAGKEE